VTRRAVFRVQARDGRGPWRPGWSHYWIEGDAPADRLAETILDLVPIDQLRALPSHLHYGTACQSREALGRWFTARERERLSRYGFHPVQLMADVVVAESDWQMVIGRRKPFAVGATRLRWDRL